MKMCVWLGLTMLGMLVCLGLPNLALAEGAAASTTTGEQILITLWNDMEKGNFEAIEAMMDPAFQSVHDDGARNKEQELKLIRNLHLGPYELSDIQVTESGETLLITYKASVEETLDGKPTNTKPAPRLSIFQKQPSGWKWLAHANLK